MDPHLHEVPEVVKRIARESGISHMYYPCDDPLDWIRVYPSGNFEYVNQIA